MQLIVFFAHHEAVKPLGKTKLFKLLYFTDATHSETAGQSITGAEYLKYPYGPVPTQGDYALKELQKHRLIRQQRVQITTERFRREITALQMPDVTIFTVQERQTVQHVIQQYGEDSAAVLSWKSHQEPAWLFAEDWRPLTLTPVQLSTEKDGKNAAALALLDEWDAIPDDKPPGYWDELEAEIEAPLVYFELLRGLKNVRILRTLIGSRDFGVLCPIVRERNSFGMKPFAGGS